MDVTAKARSARWRERKRQGVLAITVDVLPKHRRAFEAMGLIAAGYDKDAEAVAWAVNRFLDTAEAVASIGAALYPNLEDFFGEDDGEESDASPLNSDENEQ